MNLQCEAQREPTQGFSGFEQEPPRDYQRRIHPCKAVAAAVRELRAGRLSDPDRELRDPRPK